MTVLVNKQLKRIKPDTFLHDYLKSFGVDDVEKYLAANTFDNVWDYLGMEETVRRLYLAIRSKEKIGVLVD